MSDTLARLASKKASQLKSIELTQREISIVTNTAPDAAAALAQLRTKLERQQKNLQATLELIKIFSPQPNPAQLDINDAAKQPPRKR